MKHVDYPEFEITYPYPTYFLTEKQYMIGLAALINDNHYSEQETLDLVMQKPQLIYLIANPTEKMIQCCKMAKVLNK